MDRKNHEYTHSTQNMCQMAGQVQAIPPFGQLCCQSLQNFSILKDDPT